MKKIVFCGHSLEAIKQFLEASRRAAGHQLDRVQRGLDPLDWKAMPVIGNGVREIRIRSEGQYRVIWWPLIVQRYMYCMRFRRSHKKRDGKTFRQPAPHSDSFVRETVYENREGIR